MRKILTALVTVATIGATVIAMSGTAEARYWGPGGWGWRGGWGWGWGLGGFAAGALVGSALAAPYYYPYGYYGYYGYGPYYGPGPYYYYGCRPVWNGYAWVRGCY